MKRNELFDQLQLTEISNKEFDLIRGGNLWGSALTPIINLLINEWPAAQKAAIDAWNGTYNPPKS